jgi:hypothetical protein
MTEANYSGKRLKSSQLFALLHHQEVADQHSVQGSCADSTYSTCQSQVMKH